MTHSCLSELDRLLFSPSSGLGCAKVGLGLVGCRREREVGRKESTRVEGWVSTGQVLARVRVIRMSETYLLVVRLGSWPRTLLC